MKTKVQAGLYPLSAFGASLTTVTSIDKNIDRDVIFIYCYSILIMSNMPLFFW